MVLDSISVSEWKAEIQICRRFGVSEMIHLVGQLSRHGRSSAVIALLPSNTVIRTANCELRSSAIAAINASGNEQCAKPTEH